MRKALLLVVAVAMLATPMGTAAASSHVDVVAPFPAGSGPEGVAVDANGDVYVALSNAGEIWKVDPTTGSMTLFYAFANPGTFGLAFDQAGKLYAAHGSQAPDHGVWRISKDGNRAKRLPGSEAIVFPNAIAFDAAGYMYVTESLSFEFFVTGTIEGSIWRFPPTGSRTAELWYRDADLLAGTGLFGAVSPFPPIGANGIAYRNSSLYVANSEKGTIVRFPIRTDGTPGLPTVVMSGIRGLDGVAFDATGDLWAARVANGLTPRLGQILRMDLDAGTYKVIANDTHGLANPASIAFGTVAPFDRSVFTTNFNLFGAGMDDLLVTDAGVKGQDLP